MHAYFFCVCRCVCVYNICLWAFVDIHAFAFIYWPSFVWNPMCVGGIVKGKNRRPGGRQASYQATGGLRVFYKNACPHAVYLSLPPWLHCECPHSSKNLNLWNILVTRVGSSREKMDTSGVIKGTWRGGGGAWLAYIFSSTACPHIYYCWKQFTEGCSGW